MEYKVELAVAKLDHTWYTLFFFIVDEDGYTDDGEEELERWLGARATEEFYTEHPEAEVAFFQLYHYKAVGAEGEDADVEMGA